MVDHATDENEGWRCLDAELGLEVRQCSDQVCQVRRCGEPDSAVELTPDEFDQLRRHGPNPKGLD